MKGTPKVLLFAAVAGFLASLAFVLAFFGGHEVSRDLGVAPWLALILFLCLPVLGRVGRWALGPRGPVAAAVAMALVAPMIALGALHELSEPLVYGVPPWCGTGRVMLEMSVPPAMLVVGGLAALLSAGFCARGGIRALHALVLPLAALSTLLTGAAALRRAHLPETDRYVDALPVVATVPAVSGPSVTRTLAPLVGRSRAADVSRGPVEVYDAALDGALLRRACAEHHCSVALVPPGTPTDAADFRSYEVKDDALIEVRRDPARAIWVVDTFGRRSHRGPDLRLADVSVSDVAASVSPPLSWIAGAAAGLVLAAVLLVVRSRVARRHAAIAGGREGTLEASGLLTLPGGDHPLRVAPGQALAVGPVVVLPGPLSPGGVYRGDGLLVGARVACGARSELLASAEARMAELDALSLAALALTMAPLLASVAVGLVP